MKWLKNVLLCLAILFFLIIIVPLGINEAYNIGGYYTNWDAKDVLAFYGSLIGGVATLLAIFVTIRHEEKVRRVDQYSEKTKIRFNEARSQLFNAAMVLQDTNIFFSDNDVGKMISMLQRHLIEVRRCGSIEMLLDASEKEVMKSSISRLKEYTVEYDVLILRLLDANQQLLQQEPLLFKKRLRDALAEWADKNVDEISQLDQEIAKTERVMSTSSCGTVFEIQMQLSSLHNEKYKALYDAILTDIKLLEAYYDQQANKYNSVKT